MHHWSMSGMGILHRGNFLGSIGAPGPFIYIPDLGAVGSKSSYFPRDVERDAAALVFLGFLSDVDDANRQVSDGSQAADIANEGGAWDPAFRSAVTRFQSSARITADSWIGPQTRTAIAAAVAAKNAGGLALPVPSQPVPVSPGAVPAKPTVVPGVVPASSVTSDDTLMYVGIGAAVLALGGVAWWALK